MRGVMEGDPAAACRLLDIPITAASGVPEILPTSFPVATKSADLLLRVGPHRLAHVEYVRRATRDLVPRMLGYRSLIMLAHPGETLTQYVIVLGEGRVSGHDCPEAAGFWLDLKVIYLRHLPPGRLLTDTSLAPLAALGRGSPSERAWAYAEALQLIRKAAGPRTVELLTFTTELAAITLDRSIIRAIIEEVGMTIEDEAAFFSDLPWGQTLIRSGLEQGLEQGLVQALTWRLQERFGSAAAVEPIAHRLATWPDRASAFRAITAAGSLGELAQLPPPPT